MTVLVLMGVSGCGKTTVAELAAAATGATFVEGDTLHPPANVAKMSAGHPLTDEDRAPWLAAIAVVIDGWLARGAHGIVTCSALKRAYRRVLIGGRNGVRLVYLKGSEALIAARLGARRGHFMPPSLLASQFATLEEPGPDEAPLVLDIREPPDVLARRAAALIATG